MRLNALLAALVLVLTPLPVAAQELFGNPFSEASAYRDARGSLPDARYRARYESTITTHGAAPVVGEVTLDVADDWALVRAGDRTTLYDFRLNRIFTLNADSFVSRNGMGDLAFRVTERQNRSVLQRVLQAAGAQDQQLPDSCDAESELSLVIPGAPDAGVTELRERDGATAFICAGREMGDFAPSNSVAPAAFWPTVYAEMPTHPALHRGMRQDGHAPQRLSISFRGAQPICRSVHGG